MRIVLSSLTLLIAVGVTVTASAETVYPWCRQSADGSINCGFTSQAQCMDTAVGKGAICMQNPRYQGPSADSAKKSPGRR